MFTRNEIQPATEIQTDIILYSSLQSIQPDKQTGQQTVITGGNTGLNFVTRERSFTLYMTTYQPLVKKTERQMSRMPMTNMVLIITMFTSSGFIFSHNNITQVTTDASMINIISIVTMYIY